MKVQKSEKKARITLLFITLIILFTCILLFFYTPDLKYLSSIIGTLCFCIFSFCVMYLYISPRLAQRADFFYFMIALVIYVSITSTLYISFFELNIIRYPDLIHAEMIPMKQKISFFTSQSILMFFSSHFIFLYLNTFQLQAQRYHHLIEGYRTEINEMRMHTNPHFLYQSLRKLLELLEQNDFNKAYQYNSKISALLNKQLTYSMSTHISVEEELDWLSHYLNTQQQFSNEPFEYEIEIKESDIVLQRIPPLLFQPVIETFFNQKLSGQYRHHIHISIGDSEFSDQQGVKIIFTSQYESNQPLMFANTIALQNLKKRISLINEVNKFSITLTEPAEINKCVYTLTIIENNYAQSEL